jgi:hypothetical protein
MARLALDKDQRRPFSAKLVVGGRRELGVAQPLERGERVESALALSEELKCQSLEQQWVPVARQQE